MRSLSLVSGAVFTVLWTCSYSVCIASELSRRASSAMSLPEFQKCQEIVCEEVANIFNTPIDWHIVLDVSSSYMVTSRPITEKLLTLTRSLPLQGGDILTIDAFSDSYYPGDKLQEITSEWISKIKEDGGERIVESDLERLLTRLDNKPPFPSDKTNITGLFSDPKAGLTFHQAHASLKYNPYYVVLTDGAHDPEGSGRPLPLFTNTNEKDKTQSFLQSLLRFSRRGPKGSFRALFIVLDPKPVQWRHGPDLVRKDWDRGIRQIDEYKKKNGDTLLHVSFWNLGGNLFTNALKTKIGRISGIFPCLVTAYTPTGRPIWKEGHWPTITGYPYPVEPSPNCPPDIMYALTNSTAFSTGEIENEKLPLVLLASAQEKKDLLIKVSAGPVTHEPTLEPFESELDDAYSGWKPVFHSIPIPSIEKDAGASIPWVVEIAFNGQQKPKAFLKAEIFEPSLLDVTAAALKSLCYRGKIFAILAVVAWVLSVLSSWYYAEAVKVHARVEHDKGGASSSTKPIYGRKQFRFRHLQAGSEEIKEVAREDWPSRKWAKEDHIVLDVIPIFNVVYHLVYYVDSSHRPQKDCELISLSAKDGFFGAFYKASTFWQPSQWPWRPCNYSWSQNLPQHKPLKGASRKPPFQYVVKTFIQEDFRAFTARLLSTALNTLMLTFSVLAIIRSISRSADLSMATSICLFGALLFYVSRGFPKRNMPSAWWLRIDTMETFLLHALLIVAVYSCFFASDSGNRLTTWTIATLGCWLAIPLYGKIRDTLVRSRIENRQPINVWDFLLEIFLARLCS
jgi:hypothetical protein